MRSLRSLPFGLGLAALALVSACNSTPDSGQNVDSGEANKKKEKPEGYAAIVTDDTETDDGVFSVHQADDKIFFEIPNELLGRDFLLVSRIARVPADLSGGFIAAGHKTGEQVLRWERRKDRVLLRKVSFRNVADEDQAVNVSVTNNNFFPILAAFDIEAEGPADAEEDATTSVVIDVTGFFEKDVSAISGLSQSVREAHKVRSLDKNRSFVEYARSYPENIEVRQVFTFEANDPPTDRAAKTLSIEVHQSMILLPAEPMRPRHADHRVGWFTVQRTNYGLDRQKSAQEVFLSRWRLEPSDPEAYARGELVDPLEPIVYYLDPGTPEKWREYVRQGVEDWQAAFESAGFSNAILAKDPPTPEEDPEWSGEDVRHSMVRWAASTFRNAMGPSVTDPRSGEIIESDIVWFHNHMRSYRNRLLLETGAANPLARSLPVDDELLGEALRQVIAHEVGHALGLPHNMIASASYPVEKLRDPEFAREMGVSASIMDYARQNYVAQPGDGLEAGDFIRQIGPYDHYSIEWGYRVIPEAETPEDEKPILDGWILAKADDPMYRFGDRSSLDPRSQTEDLSDDPVTASGYGLANLKRVAPKLIEWTSTPGEDYADLEELYGELLVQFSRYMGHVVTLIGGTYQDRKAADQDGHVYSHVPAAEQRRAMAFLAEHVFATPEWLLDPEILRRISGGGEVDDVVALQARFLRRLLDPARLERLTEAAMVAGDDAYTAAELFNDVRNAVGPDVPTPYRRALQRAHVEQLKVLVEGSSSDNSDVAALARRELEIISELTRPLQGSATDPLVEAHFHDLNERIQSFLEGREIGS